MSTALYRRADVSYRAPAPRPGGVAILAVVSLGLLGRGTAVDNSSVPGTQSQQALTQLEQAIAARSQLRQPAP
jgi:hypothetical protein